MKIKPDPNCKSCHGTGEVLDFVPVPFGSGNCAMPSLCSCIEEQIPENYEDDIEVDLSDYISPYNPDFYEYEVE